MRHAKLDIYEHTTYNTPDIKRIINNLEWIHKTDHKEVDLDTQFIQVMYSRAQHFGVTDYKDHRNDTVGDLKRMILKNLKKNIHQRGHFYDYKGNPVREIIVWGYRGGYSGHFIYPCGSNAFGKPEKNPTEKISKKETKALKDVWETFRDTGKKMSIRNKTEYLRNYKSLERKKLVIGYQWQYTWSVGLTKKGKEIGDQLFLKSFVGEENLQNPRRNKMRHRRIAGNPARTAQKEYEEPFEPDEEDVIISYTNEIFSGSEYIGKASNWEDQVELIQEWMRGEGFYPNVWQLSDHGNYHLIRDFPHPESKGGRYKKNPPMRYRRNIEEWQKGRNMRMLILCLTTKRRKGMFWLYVVFTDAEWNDDVFPEVIKKCKKLHDLSESDEMHIRTIDAKLIKNGRIFEVLEYLPLE